MTAYFSVNWYLCQDVPGDLESEPYRGEQHGMSHTKALGLVNSIINENWRCVYQDEHSTDCLYKLEDLYGHMIGVVRLSPDRTFSRPLDKETSL